jgi:hypothetical protein
MIKKKRLRNTELKVMESGRVAGVLGGLWGSKASWS